MVIRLDSNRVKDVVNNIADPIGVDGDSTTISQGVSEADKIVEGAKKNIATSGVADDPASAEKANEETLQRMANRNSEEEPGPEMVNQNNQLPSVDILSPNKGPSGQTQ
jgi:protein phosphatase PTC1